MKRSHRATAILIAAGLLGGSAMASAAVTRYRVDSFVSEPDPGSSVGYRTNDLFIDFTGNLGGNQILLTLTEGTIFNAPPAQGGGDTAPLGVLATTFPETGFDTFVGLGASTADDPGYTATSIFGGAVDLGGDPETSFGPSVMNVTFAPAVGETITDGTRFQIARITLSTDAQGTFVLLGSTLDGGLPTIWSGWVIDGCLNCVPEPAGGVLLAAAMAAAAGVRRRRVACRVARGPKCLGAAAALAIALGAAGQADAQVKRFYWSFPDNSAGPANTVTNDLFIDFTGNLGGNQILLTLTEGSIFNAPPAQGGGDTAPLGVLATTFPETGFDTFVGLGATTSDDANYTATSIFGGAVDLGGDASTNFDGPLNVAFAPSVGETVTDGTMYQVARITLSADAQGDILYLGSLATGGTPFIGMTAIINGQVCCVPEPMSGVLLAAAMAAAAGVRRRRVACRVAGGPKCLGAAAALAVVLGAAGESHAQVTRVYFEYPDNSAAPAGTVTTDIFIDFTGNLGGNQILLELTQGSIFNAPAAQGGGDTAPLGILTTTFPETAFDTFVGMGATTSDDPGYTATSIFGGAVDLGGDPAASFDGPINVAFAPSVGETVTDGSRYQVARITLSADAQGEFRYLGSLATGGTSYTRTVSIIDACFACVPEPTSGVLLAAAMAAVRPGRRARWC
ncbi:MAG: PEP-CTERM sorting domain-containing protein [Planctomycetota bacterium]